jgi:hypothetical protein
MAWKKVLGWAAVAVLAAVAAVWFLWGFVESFVEHWHYGSVEMDFALMVARYLLPILLLLALLLFALRPPEPRARRRRTATRIAH